MHLIHYYPMFKLYHTSGQAYYHKTQKYIDATLLLTGFHRASYLTNAVEWKSWVFYGNCCPSQARISRKQLKIKLCLPQQRQLFAFPWPATNWIQIQHNTWKKFRPVKLDCLWISDYIYLWSKSRQIPLNEHRYHRIWTEVKWHFE